MNRAAKIRRHETRALRAALLCLAVIAQLILPGVVLRAQAIAGELCVTSGSGSGSPSSKAHAHDQQCAHCRLHDCSPVTPPSARAVVVEPPVRQPAAVFEAVALRPSWLQARPPPTGPPPV
jgi:hypothetical protein